MSEAKRREPSCTLNHDAQRRELRAARVTNAVACRGCGWSLKAMVDVQADIEEERRETVYQHLSRIINDDYSVANNVEKLVEAVRTLASIMRDGLC